MTLTDRTEANHLALICLAKRFANVLFPLIPATKRIGFLARIGPNSPNLQLGSANYPVSAPALTVDLTTDKMPLPRLRAHRSVVIVPAYTDLKLHDISATSDRSGM